MLFASRLLSFCCGSIYFFCIACSREAPFYLQTYYSRWFGIHLHWSVHMAFCKPKIRMQGVKLTVLIDVPWFFKPTVGLQIWGNRRFEDHQQLLYMKTWSLDCLSCPMTWSHLEDHCHRRITLQLSKRWSSWKELLKFCFKDQYQSAISSCSVFQMLKFSSCSLVWISILNYYDFQTIRIELIISSKVWGSS